MQTADTVWINYRVQDNEMHYELQGNADVVYTWWYSTLKQATWMISCEKNKKKRVSLQNL